MKSFQIIIDEDSLNITAQRSIVGVIYFQTGEKCFPEKNWSDFVVVLAHWLNSAVKMKDLRLVKFGFMDGPFELVASRRDIKIDAWDLIGNERGSNEELQIANEISALTINKVIQKAALEILAICQKKKIVSPDLDEMRRALSNYPLK